MSNYSLPNSELSRLRTLKEKVRYLLEKYPEARNDDLYLYILYLREFEPQVSKFIKYIPYKLIHNTVKPEAISRMRRKIQENGELLPTDPDVIRKRRLHEQRIRKTIKRV